MTNRNGFGETIHTPEDHPTDFTDYADEQGGGIYEARVSEDPAFGWCASVSTNKGDDLHVHDFPDRESLVTWLVEAGVPANEIEDDQ